MVYTLSNMQRQCRCAVARLSIRGFVPELLLDSEESARVCVCVCVCVFGDFCRSDSYGDPDSGLTQG